VDPDSAFHVDADPDQNFYFHADMLIYFTSVADPNPTFHFDADPISGSLQIRIRNAG
jgi:hypothetical protein